MSPKRICMVVQNYYKIDPRVRREADALVDHGHMVDVLALREDKNGHQQFILNGVHVYTIYLSKKRAGKWRYIGEYLCFFILAGIWLAWRTIKFRYDAIQVCTLPDFLVFSAIIPKLFGALVILDMHEVMPEFFMSKYGVPENHLIIHLLKWQEKLSMKFADKVILINDPIKELLEQRGLPKGKAAVVMNSVNEKLFAVTQDLQQNQNQAFVFMYHGTLTPIYGLDIALKAFANVHELLPDAEFWIIGDGPERNKLESLARHLGVKDIIKFLGTLPQQEIPAWLALCDVGVLPTRQDSFLDLSFSNKLPEYIIMGKPVIISRLKSIRRYFSENALAYFEPHDQYDLAQKMVQLYHNPVQRDGLVEKSTQEYSAISWDVMKTRYLNIMEKNAGG